MGTRQGPLSDLQLRRWLKDSQKLARSDGGGLTFTISAAGFAAWVLRYSQGDRRFELSLGPYPDLTLSDARAMAALRRADILKGTNPAIEKRKAKGVAVKDMSVRELIKDYKEKVPVSLAKSTRTCYSRHLRRIDNRLGTLGVREVEPSDIVGLIEDSKLTWGESSLLHITAKCLFTHGWACLRGRA